MKKTKTVYLADYGSGDEDVFIKAEVKDGKIYVCELSNTFFCGGHKFKYAWNSFISEFYKGIVTVYKSFDETIKQFYFRILK